MTTAQTTTCKPCAFVPPITQDRTACVFRTCRLKTTRGRCFWRDMFLIKLYRLQHHLFERSHRKLWSFARSIIEKKARSIVCFVFFFRTLLWQMRRSARHGTTLSTKATRDVVVTPRCLPLFLRALHTLNVSKDQGTHRLFGYFFSSAGGKVEGTGTEEACSSTCASSLFFDFSSAALFRPLKLCNRFRSVNKARSISC